MSVKKFAAAFCCLAIVAGGVAEAKKSTIKVKNLEVFDIFPGVDDQGDLDFGNTFDGFVSGTLNLKTNKATISGKAVVDNDDNKRATFNNEDLAGAFIGGDMISDRYTVNKNGKATYSGRYENVAL